MVRTPGDIAEIKLCDGTACGHGEHDGLGNIADVTLAAGVAVPLGARRNFLTTSACGVCGKASIHDICVLPQAALAGDAARFEPAMLALLPERLREAQRVLSSTGGLHAAGLFTAVGDLVAIREDVGRHNAVDKVVGWALLNGRLPLAGCVLLVSGRASFELVQKAVLAGIPLLAAVSAPSSLAVELAEEAGLTLVGFLRGPSMNVYTGARWAAPRSACAAMDGIAIRAAGEVRPRQADRRPADTGVAALIGAHRPSSGTGRRRGSPHRPAIVGQAPGDPPRLPAGQGPAAGSARSRRRSRCGPTVYFGSRAETRPASNTPNRVTAEPASSAAPPSAETARLRRPSSAATVPAPARICPARIRAPDVPVR